MYSVIHAVILDPVPYKDPHRLISVTVRGDRGGNGSYYPLDQFVDIAERNTVFAGVVASTCPTSPGPATANPAACAAITAP